MLGQREKPGEHDATLKMMKNEFMKQWGHLLKRKKECVMVLAATNRP